MPRNFPTYLHFVEDHPSAKSKGEFVVRTVEPKFIAEVKKDEWGCLQSFEILEFWDLAYTEQTSDENKSNALRIYFKALKDWYINRFPVKAAMIDKITRELKKGNFKEGVDKNSSFGTGVRLFYKKVSTDKNQFLVFALFNESKTMSKATFDCYLVTYQSDKNILEQEPITNKTIKLSFDFRKDFGLIKEYFYS